MQSSLLLNPFESRNFQGGKNCKTSMKFTIREHNIWGSTERNSLCQKQGRNTHETTVDGPPGCVALASVPSHSWS